MAKHKSAEKRNRQRERRTAAARGMRTRVRHVLKSARLAVEEKSATAAEPRTLAKHALSLLDRAASKKLIPFERVSRLKSRLERKLGATQAAK